jgi:cytochrome P450
MSPLDFDPFRSEQRANPYPAYAELRRHAPVHRIESSGLYAVSRYAEVLHVLRHPELFSSSAMLTVLAGAVAGASPIAGMGVRGAEADRFSELAQSLPTPPMEALAARSLIGADPPVHGPLRNLVNRGFTPRRISALEPRIRQIARAALDGLADEPEPDLVAGFFVPLPVTVICELLGIEPERAEDFKHWSDVMVSGMTGSAAGGAQQLVQVFAEMTAYVTRVAEGRRVQPREDLISTLVRAEAGEMALQPFEITMFITLLLVAGNETTTNLLGNAVLALIEHPQQLARVRRDPSLVPALVEETLRYDPPAQFVFRRATRDVELAGTKIPAGATVMPLLASANRDDAQFPDGDRFDIARDTSGHLGFGFGIHFCLGASLARLEARVALEELLARYAGFERASARVDYIDSFLVRGPSRLPLRLAAA